MGGDSGTALPRPLRLGRPELPKHREATAGPELPLCPAPAAGLPAVSSIPLRGHLLSLMLSKERPHCLCKD